MKVAVCSAMAHDRQFLLEANQEAGHELVFFEAHLCKETLPMVQGFPAVCAFVNDKLGADILQELAQQGTRLIALRCAGFNNVDIDAAIRCGVRVVRVPAYSPHSVAEHAMALILTLNRKTHRAYNRVRDGNFSLDGLLGFELRGRTVGIIGTGRIGTALAAILQGFGCHVLAHDPLQSADCQRMGVRYVELNELYAQSDIISLHCPLSQHTFHLIDAAALAQMKHGVMLINTSRGAVLDTSVLSDALKSGQIGYLGLDVYEQEDELFFQDHSGEVILDDLLERLLMFHNVLITGHQGFFTHEALSNIARTTLANLSEIERTGRCQNEVLAR